MKKNLKIVFFGTPHFAAVILDRLKESGIEMTLIITAPDKPKGRKLVMTPPEVKVWAHDNEIDVLQPDDLCDENFLEDLKNTDWHLFIVASYGTILPKGILDIPKHGTLNVHPSLLPKLRGASPIISAIITDEKKTGVSIMLVDEKMDHGPIVAQASIEIENLPDSKMGWPPHASMLSEILATEGGNLLAEVIEPFIAGEITPEEQEHSKATYTTKVQKEDGLIDLSDPLPTGRQAHENLRKIRAYEGWPGTYFFIKKGSKDVRIKIMDAQLKDGKLIITRVIPEGRREMDYEDFLRG